MTMLTEQNLPDLEVAQPAYPRGKLKCGIVHLGVGGFHRAHQAVYTDDVLATGDLNWGIVGGSLRSSSVRTLLKPQDYLYTVQKCAGHTNSVRVIGCLLEVLAVPDIRQLTQLINTIAHGNTRAVTLTITEKGYCLDNNGALDVAHVDVMHDLQTPATPRSAIGLICRGLAKRKVAGAGPISVISCDNLSGNGRATAQAVATMSHLLDPDLAAWVKDNVSFPNTMVDRIVPVTQAEDVRRFETRHGYRDQAVIRCEPFCQWVIEDHFIGARPPWDLAGATFANQVAPYEQAKLRLLNATHSAMAYLGLLAGFDFVHETQANTTLAAFARVLMDVDITPEVNCPSELDLEQYKADVLQRFANTAIAYRTSQVAADGSQKLPQRLFPMIEEKLNKQTSITRLCLVVAAWIRCLQGRADDQGKISIDDPRAASIAGLAAAHTNPKTLINAIARDTGCFGKLSHSERFIAELSEQFTLLADQGSLGAVAKSTSRV